MIVRKDYENFWNLRIVALLSAFRDEVDASGDAEAFYFGMLSEALGGYHRITGLSGDQALDRLRDMARQLHIGGGITPKPAPDDSALRAVADRAYRFFGGLSLRDHAIVVQREAVEVIRQLGKVLKPRPTPALTKIP